jgi:hypothetical protein
MTVIQYFAYGSNILNELLRERCKSAKMRCVAAVDGYKLVFSKKSQDRSGKATIRPDEASRVYGVVFDLDETELPALVHEARAPGASGESDLRLSRSGHRYSKKDCLTQQDAGYVQSFRDLVQEAASRQRRASERLHPKIR